MKIEGVGPEQKIVTNEAGGSQSLSPYRMDLIDPIAILEVAKVLDQGARKYGEDNWRLIEANEHLNHALVHIYAYLAGDTTDEHIEHATTRMIFALAKKKENE